MENKKDVINRGQRMCSRCGAIRDLKMFSQTKSGRIDCYCRYCRSDIGQAFYRKKKAEKMKQNLKK